MCGIVGVIGRDDTTEVLLNGLEKLEYRGYDSAGIYVDSKSGDGHLVKEKGKIAELRAAVGPDVKGTVGIGHTRWATHGIRATIMLIRKFLLMADFIWFIMEY